MDGWGMMDGMGMMSGWGMWMGPFFMVLVPVLIIVLIVWFVRGLRPSPTTTVRDHPTARDILDVRYAKGELDDEEYQRRLAALRRD